jgi:MFS family permease
LGRENGLTFWGMIFLEASFGSYFALWPLWIEELGASITLVGLLLGLGGILRLGFLLPSAMLIRRFGLLRLLLAVRLVASAGILWAAFAQEWWWLLPAQLGMACGEMAFALIPNSIAANAGRNRVRAFAIVMTMGPSVSLLLTPVLSGGLVSVWGLRAPFVAAAAFSLVSVAFFAWLKPVTVSADERSAPLRRVNGLPRIFALQLATFFGLGLGTSLVPNYLRDEAGYAESTIAVMTGATALGSIVFAVVVARSARFTHAPLRAVAIAVGFAMLAYLLLLVPDYLALVLVALTLRGGFFAAWPLYSAVLGEAADERLRPHAFAMGEILAGTGFILSPILAGPLYDIRPDLPLICSAILLAPLIVTLARVHVPRADLTHHVQPVRVEPG